MQGCCAPSDRIRHETARHPLIYVAGPYTRPDPVENTHHIVRIADALLDAGFVPVVPHLTLLWHLISPKPYEHWLAYDQLLLQRCDALLRVPGDSQGATQEAELAELLRIPVIWPRSADPAHCVAAAVGHFSD